MVYENEDDRRSFSKYYAPTIEIKDYNILVDRKAFFELLVKSMTEIYEKITDLGNNDYYTTGNLLDYEYFKKHCKLIAIDLSKQRESENNDVMKQVDFIRKLERDAINNVYPTTAMFFIIEKREKTVIDFSKNSAVIVSYNIYMIALIKWKLKK